MIFLDYSEQDPFGLVDNDLGYFDFSKIVQRPYLNIDFTIYSTDVLTRMLNCRSYYFSLSDRDAIHLYDVAADRYYDSITF